MDWRKACFVTFIAAITILSSEVFGRKQIRPDLSCENVKTSLESIPNARKTILASPQYDAQIDVCRFTNHSETRRPTCCTHHTEQQFLLASPKGFRQIIQDQTKHVLKKLQESGISSIIGEYKKMTHIAHKMTEYELGQLLSVPHSESREIVQPFFSTIVSYFDFNRTVPIFEPLDTMLDELFIHVIQTAENTTSGFIKELDPDYKLCVKSTRRLLSPPVFSEQAEKYIASLHYYLLAASYLAESLHLAESFLKDIKDVEIIEECYRDYAKLEYCQKCYGYYQMQPCREFCEEVHLVCLHQLVKFETDWNYHLRVISILAEYLIGRTDVQAAMNGLSGEMKTHTLYALTEYPKYAAKLAGRCGPVTHISSSTASPRKVTWNPPEVTKHTTDMKQLLQNVMVSSINDLEGVFASLPQRVCSGMPRGGSSCWDGLKEKKKKGMTLSFLDMFAPYPVVKPDLIKDMKTQIQLMRQGLIEIFTPANQQDEKQDGDLEGSGSGNEELYNDSEDGDEDDPQPNTPLVTRTKHITKMSRPIENQLSTKVAAIHDSKGAASFSYLSQLTVMICALFPVLLHSFS